ncbi:MAG: hypothetical protein K2X47_10095 [Bdellovibrionales bacterium]|nr:hypothetical protein [Bdellovibrionales bacterium]
MIHSNVLKGMVGLLLFVLTQNVHAELLSNDLEISNISARRDDSSGTTVFGIFTDPKPLCIFGDETICTLGQLPVDQELIFRFHSSVKGVGRMMQANATTKVENSTTTLVEKGEIAEVKATWSDVCEHVTGDSTCRTSGVGTIIVGVDPFFAGSTMGNLSNSIFKQVISVRIVGNCH